MRRVLIPLDGSDRGDAILSFLDRLPELRARELVLLRVLSAGDDAEAAWERLDRTTRRLADSGLRPIPLITFGDEPAAEILKAVDLVRPWVVALSTHGKGDSKAQRGSVAVKVIETCRAPLLLVGRQALPLDPGPGFHRVLLAIDGSPDAGAALDITGDLAPADAEVLLMHVAGTGGMDLDEAQGRLRRDGVGKLRTLDSHGDPARSLLDVAARERVDLIAIGARTPDGRALGETAREVAQRSDCPLLLAR